MKVLFLDIDGVCNSLAYALANGMNLIDKTDPEAVKLVRQIIEETGCFVVLSSTWRLYPKSKEVVERDVCEILDSTPHIQGYSRGKEIKVWLDKHHEVDIYAILDDDSDFLPYQPLFKTTFEKGLTPDVARAVIKHLNSVDKR